jgi:hypothetical protein
VNCPNEPHCGGCSVSAAVTGASTPASAAPIVSRVNATAANVTFFFSHGAAVSVSITAADGAGNRASTLLRWAVETETPVTLRPQLAPFTNETALVLALNCSKAGGCTYEYNLDNTGWRPVGNSSANTTAASSNAVDTVGIVTPPLFTRNTSADFAFAAQLPVGAGGASSVDVRLDGATLWTSVPSNASYAVSGLGEGYHILEARARYV